MESPPNPRNHKIKKTGIPFDSQKPPEALTDIVTFEAKRAPKLVQVFCDGLSRLGKHLPTDKHAADF